jgi:hypothetical protein
MPSHLLVLLTLLALGAGEGAVASTHATPEAALTATVREIAVSASLSRDDQEKAVAKAVRAAIAAAVEGISSDEEIVGIAVRFAAAAAGAGPQFSLVIIKAAAEIPAIAKVKDAAGRIAAAVRAAAKSARPGSPEFGGDHDDVVISPSR